MTPRLGNGILRRRWQLVHFLVEKKPSISILDIKIRGNVINYKPETLKCEEMMPSLDDWKC